MSPTPLSVHQQSQANSPADAQLTAARMTVTDWLHLIRAEYFESPGLQLTKKQAERLWGLDSVTCETLLGALIDSGFLKQTHTGRYVRADLGP